MKKPFELTTTVDRAILHSWTPLDVWLYAERKVIERYGKRPAVVKVLFCEPQDILPLHTN